MAELTWSKKEKRGKHMWGKGIKSSIIENKRTISDVTKTYRASKKKYF